MVLLALKMQRCLRLVAPLPCCSSIRSGGVVASCCVRQGGAMVAWCVAEGVLL
jgi:hypothetical protein